MVKMPVAALEGISLTTPKAGNPMDKIIVIFSLVGLAIWLSHTATKKRGKFHERID
jgi:hypothetical protein